MAKTKEYYRTFLLPNDANKTKLDKIRLILPEYQHTSQNIQYELYRRWQNGTNFYNRADIKSVESNLSERYKRSALNQVVAGLDSWETTLQDAFRKLVSYSKLDANIKYDLYRINLAKGWYKKNLLVAEPILYPDNTTTIMWMPIPLDTLFLARRILKHVLKTLPIPDLYSSNTMHLDNTVAQFEPSKTNSYDYWARISTLDKGKPVWIPLYSYRYAEQAEGLWSSLAQITINDDNSISYKQVKKAPKVQPKKPPKKDKKSDKLNPTSGIVGLDFGMLHLFATSEGDLVGHDLYGWLVERDRELETLTKRLRQQHIKFTDSKRYNNLQSRINEYVSNEINRCLNRIVFLYNPHTIVVEKLDFRGGGLSKQLNRILSRFGRHAIKLKLTSLKEELGINVVYVPAAYTSLECSKCGFVSKENRRGEKFLCEFCGYKTHADYNASLTIRSRRSWTKNWHNVSRTKLLEKLDTEFYQRWNINPNVFRRRKEKYKVPYHLTSEKVLRPNADGLAIFISRKSSKDTNQ